MERWHFLWVATLVVSFGGRAAAQPDAPEAGASAVATAAPEAAPAADRWQYDSRRLLGLAGDRIVWAIELLPRQRRGEEPAPPPPIVRSGDVLFTCAQGQLYRFSPADGRVLARWAMPGACASLEPLDGGRVRVEVRGTPEAEWSRTYEVGDAAEDVPFTVPQGPAAMLLQRQATWLDLPPGASDAELARTAARNRAMVESSIERLANAGRLDPTNPWIPLMRARYLSMLGHAGEARAALDAVLAIDPRYDLELLRVAAALDRVDPALGARAFERGMRFALAHGYEPEAAVGLLGAVVYLDPPRPMEGADAPIPRDALVRFGHRLAEFAPRAEGSSGFYRAMATSAPSGAGEDDVRARWEALEANAEGTGLLASFGGGRFGAGDLLNALLAMLATFVVFFAVKTLRTFSARVGTMEPWLRRFGPTARWTAGERWGLVLLAVPLLLVGQRAATEIAVIGLVAGAPVELLGGDLGHPAVVETSAEMVGSPGGDLVRAIALQRSGDVEGAAAIYEALPDVAEAQVNLGVIRKSAGDEAGARAAFERAIAIDPDSDAAAHHLGRRVASLRVERAKRYGVEASLLALPSPAQWAEAWRTVAVARNPGVLGNPFRAIGGLFQVTDAGFVDGAFPGALAAVLVWLACVLGVVAGSPAVLGAPRFGRLGYVLGLLVPGAARSYSFFGPFVATLFFAACVGAITLHTTDGLASNVLEAIAEPSFDRYYGVYEAAPEPSRGMTAFYRSWWILLLAHVAFVAIAERRSPDPAWKGPPPPPSSAAKSTAKAPAPEAVSVESRDAE